ncbi:MAG TPA: retropepsin-like aspartic protease [Isosphaeraceae bacterium]
MPAPFDTPGRPWPVGAWNMPGWVEIPLTLTKNGHYHLEVEVGAERLNMILDTGADNVTLDRKVVAERLKLPTNKVLTRGVGFGAGTVRLQSTSLPTLKIGSFESGPCDTSVTDLSNINEFGTRLGLPPVDGVLGASFLRAHKAVIDYPKHKLLLYDPTKAGDAKK